MLKGNRNAFSLFTRKRQIRTSDNVSRKHNKKLEQLEKLYPSKN